MSASLKLVPNARDFVTVLECEDSTPLAKRFVGPERKKLDYGNAYYVAPTHIAIDSLDDLLVVLEELRSSPHACIVRGTPLREIDHGQTNGTVRRIAQAKPRFKGRADSPIDAPAFAPAAHRANMIDDDGGTIVVFDADDLQGTAERWRAALPECLRGAELLVSFSASQRPGGVVRAHAWFWSDTPLSDIPLRRWARRNNLDGGLYNPVQPHYTADPIFEECDDPLPSREIIHLPGTHAALDFAFDDLAEQPARKLGAPRSHTRLSVSYAELPEPRQDEESIARRAAVAKPLEPLFSKPGKRWDACGYVGGACANAGLPPEECIAILESLRWDDVDDDAAARGVEWALGAYDCPVEPMGISGIAELAKRPDNGKRLSSVEVTSTQVAGALRSYAQEITRGITRSSPEPAEDLTDGNTRAPDAWSTTPFQFFDAEREPEPLEYVWGPFAAGKVSAIVGHGYSSKTPFALDLAVCIASGKAAHGHATKQRRVMYVATEGARNARRKAQRIARAHGTSLAELAGDLQVVAAPSGFLNAESIDALLPVLRSEQVGVLFLDTYGSALDGNIDRNTAAFSDALKQLGDESDRAGVVFVVLLHTRKDKGGQTSNALHDIDGHNSAGNALQGAVKLSRPNDDDKTLIRVECIRAPDDEIEPFNIRWEDVRDPKATPARFGSAAPDPQWGLRASPSDGEAAPHVRKRLDAQHAATMQATKAEVIAFVRAHPLCTAAQLQGGIKANGLNIKAARIDLVTAGVLVETQDRASLRYTIK